MSEPVREADLDKIARVIVGIPWAQAMDELDNDELPGGSAFALAAFRALLADRDRLAGRVDRLESAARRVLAMGGHKVHREGCPICELRAALSDSKEAE